PEYRGEGADARLDLFIILSMGVPTMFGCRAIIWLVNSIAVVALSLCLSGCLPVTANTSQAIYDPATDPPFDAKLVGIWLPEYLCVNLDKGDGNSYLVRSGGLGGISGVPDGAESQRSIHLVRIGKYDYLFAAPKAGEAGTSLTDCCRVEWRPDRVAIRNL